MLGLIRECFSSFLVKGIAKNIIKMTFPTVKANIANPNVEIKKDMNSNTGMTDQEYLMNRKIIEKAHKELIKS